MPAKTNKQFLSFGRKLFISVISLFVIFVTCFIIYQYHREKQYKIQLLHSKLQDYNDIIYNEITRTHKDWSELIDYIKLFGVDDLRVTVINFNGDVLFDSSNSDLKQLSNHLHRKEIEQALSLGNGYDVRRTSEITGISYFYSATSYKNFIIRTAIPYDLVVRDSLKIEIHYLWLSLLVAFLLILIFYKYTNNLGISISQLKEFTTRIEHNEPINELLEFSTPKDELGEIAQHLFKIYRHLHETKEALFLEREKLITHLQTSKEGLAVFTKDKKEVLVNNLFIQYINIISDTNLEKSEDIFDVPEFGHIKDFIKKVQKRPVGKDEKKTSFNINKNGKIFLVECIVFQDLSFEISINDISLEEEQSLLKRQLTQNIAHELKTPVSSIQAYLETIVTNDNLPADKTAVFLQRCYEQSNRLTKLLRDISVLTRMDEAVDMMEIEFVDISAMVQKIINEVSIDIDKKDIIVQNNLKTNMLIRGNYSLIYSIFRNLMDNSIAYAGQGIQITINCFREDNEFYYFSFADTGVGVGPEHLLRLFERFYRVDKGRSRKLGGTGLGLAIVKNAVLLHGGSISAKNNKGGGLEFIFTLAKDK